MEDLQIWASQTIAKIKQLVRHFFKNIELSTVWSVLLGERFYDIMQCNEIVCSQLSSVSNGVYSKCSGSQAEMAVAQHGGLIVESIWACVNANNFICQENSHATMFGRIVSKLFSSSWSKQFLYIIHVARTTWGSHVYAENYTLHPECFLFWLLHF